MKLIIDIDENLCSYILKEDSVYFPDDGGELFEAVKNGTPLPKGHGDLVDRNDLLQESYCIYDWWGNEINIVDVMTVKMAPTIIEADNGE